jgi:nickel/cobalt transporter (NicO) family protein
MTPEMTVLSITAASIALVHTLIGPDHYVPFVVMSKAREWSMRKTVSITVLCGIGHILSSVVLGLVGVAFGVAVGKLEALESIRGNVAGWALIAFGLVYFAWGMRRAAKNRPHSHLHLPGMKNQEPHTHADGTVHTHEHAEKANITPWILFTVFVLGPCEPLIPILMYPAARHSVAGLVWVTSVFGIVTISTMVTVVVATSLGIKVLPTQKLERYMHALAGATIAVCGLAIQFLGL